MHKSVKRLTVFLVFCLFLASASVGIAANSIKLVVNEREVKCDVPPQLVGGRVLVPVRFVAEALGASVKWDDKTKTVFVETKGGSSDSATIKGVVTYKFNWNLGSVADIGAKVYAFPLDHKPDPKYGISVALGVKDNPQNTTPIVSATVDGTGAYSMSVKPGRYAVLISSEHQNKHFKKSEEIWQDIGILSQYFSGGESVVLITHEFAPNDYKYLPEVVVSPGETVECNAEF